MSGDGKDETNNGVADKLQDPTLEKPKDEETALELDDADKQAVWLEWSNTTSIHGTPYILHPNFRWWKRCIWICLVLTSTSLMIWQIHTLVKDYLQFETTTSFKVVVPRSLPFPEVILCNLNSFQLSRMIAADIGAPINEEELLEISQPLSEFIELTSFNFRSLKVKEAWQPVVTSSGLCFRFNTNETVSRPGLEGGLAITLKLNKTEYRNDTGLAGVQVYVAQHGTTEVGQSPFDLVIPGSFGYIGITREVLTRETDPPWSDCSGEAPEYTQVLCRAGCLRDSIREECGCRDYADKTAQTVDFCTNVDDCLLSLNADHDIVEDSCEDTCALPPCFEEMYQTQSTLLALAPRSAEAADALQFVCPRLAPDDISGEKLSDLKESICLHINYQAIRQENVTESKATTFSQLLSNIGGQMGLFMGLSMLSLVEVFGELLALRCVPRLWGDRRLYGVGSKQG